MISGRRTTIGSDEGRKVRVSAAQIKVGDQIGENLERILAMMRRAGGDGVEMVVFPETCLTGYSPDIGHGRDRTGWPVIQEGLEAIARLASELGIWVTVGAEAWDGQAWLNRLQVYSDKGQPVATYDKVHLTRGDRVYYRAGGTYATFDMKGVKFGLQICYDIRFPIGYRSLLAKGAEVILQSYCSTGHNIWKLPVVTCMARARCAESGFFLVGANVANPLQTVLSQIVDPAGLLLAQSNLYHEELITADLDLSLVGDSGVRQDKLTRLKHGAMV